MKKLLGCILFVAIAVVGISFSAQAAVDCPVMTITMISADAADGGNVWLRNDSGDACGTIAAGASQYFLLHPDEVDKLLAVGLTAVSLGNSLWVRAEGDAAGSYITIFSMTNANATP